jgi:nucleoside-diphosphate-sugar epimerase
MNRALVCGAGGFIGGHLVKKLKKEGYWVRGVDIKEHEFDGIAQTYPWIENQVKKARKEQRNS